MGIRHLVLDGHPRDLADLEGFGVGLARPHLGEVEEDDADVEALGATRLAQRGVRVELAVAGRDMKIFLTTRTLHAESSQEVPTSHSRFGQKSTLAIK